MVGSRWRVLGAQGPPSSFIMTETLVAKGVVVIDPRRHSREAPMGCDTGRPRLTWTVSREPSRTWRVRAAAPPAPERWRPELDTATLRSQAANLDPEMRAYELLHSEALKSFERRSAPGLTNTLVKARAARGWAQRRLAEELSMAAQQIRRGEVPSTHQPAGHSCATSRRRSAPRWAKSSPLAPMRRDERHGSSLF